MSASAEWDVGTDIGGTFTDIVAVRVTTGETRTAKVPSQPDAPVAAMLEAIAAVSLAPSNLRRFVHGTTRITNAIVQDRMPPVALIATAGFEDVLEIGRYRRRDLYRLDIPPKAPPLVPRERCFDLAERMDHAGRAILAPSEAELSRMVDWVRASGVASVAVCLLHAYANPAHERLVGERLRGVVDHVSLSHDINPEAREYERASSTAYNAAAMPIAVEYLEELERRLPLGDGLQVFHSAGGMVPVAAAKRRPIVMAMSGPAAGVAASVRAAQALGRKKLLTFDMGGTTTDVCLVVDGAAEMADARMAGDRPLRQPMLAVHSIGAGGGSLVELGPGGLSVGPRSAGAEPGPACYGRGGTQATVTDANLLLGYLDPARRFGHRISLDPELAARSIKPIADRLGMDPIRAALGIVKVANATMARALRRVTVERGIDGRDCALLAFGGGGPMHAAGLAELYGIDEIVAPPASSAFSALGCLVSDQTFLQQKTVRLPLRETPREVFAAQIDALAREAAAPLAAEASKIVWEYTALMRYRAQSGAMPVAFVAPLDPIALERDFHEGHRRLYGYSTDEPPVVESLRVRARLPSSARAPVWAAGTPHAARSRTCAFQNVGEVETAILHRDGLRDHVEGPAIIEDDWSTVIVPPGWRARPERDGYLFLARNAAAHGSRAAARGDAKRERALDPFAVEVVRHGLSSAAEEMSSILVRSARSPLLREAGDLSSTIADAEGELVAQGRDIPVHLGAMAYTIRELLKVYPKERMRDGDALIYNLGALGGNHLNDVKVVRPVFVDGAIVAFALSLAHWPDVGGSWPGSYYAASMDTFQEAIRIPPVLIATRDGVEKAALAFIRVNVRDPVACEGDLLGQIAATAAGARRIQELCAAHGTEFFLRSLARLQDLSEAEMREALAGLPDGVYEGEDHLDEGARAHVRVAIHGDSATFDLSGSGDRLANFCNTTPFIARSAVAYAARILSGREMQQNAGALRPLTIVTRPGSMFEPGWDAAVAAGNHESSMRIVDAAFRAMERVVPERLAAGGPTTSGLMLFAEPIGGGSWRLLYEVHGGGEGARHDRDGCPATRVHMTNTSNTPAEMIEALYAITVERQAIRRGSGGAGRFRGGDGLVRAYRVHAPEMLLATCVERMRAPPYGFVGGQAGLPFRITLERDGETTDISGKCNIFLRSGDLVTLESCGGGGYGAPAA